MISTTRKRIKESRLLKRPRRSKAEMEAFKDRIYEVVEEDHPLTVRQTFYRLVAHQEIEKTQNSYKNLVSVLGKMRREGRLPFSWISDNTRWMHKPKSYDSMSDLLYHSQQTYRRAIWNDQDVYIEIWCESDAISGVLYDVTAEWDVPLMPTKGFASLTFLQSAASTINQVGKPSHLFYFGDYDPSGVHIDKRIERDLREFAPDADIEFERVAVTAEQIDEWNLPGAPPKKSDTRAKSFKGESVEIEAIPPQKLRDICSDCITSLVDQDALRQMIKVEIAERQTLDRIVDALDDGEFDGEETS